MSATATRIDAIASLDNWLKGLTGMYIADLKAIPADKLNVSPGGKARPVSAITAEVIGLCHYCAAILKDETPPAHEDGTESGADLTTHEALIAGFTDATAQLSAALTSATDETLNKVVTPPWHMDAPVYMIAQITVSHIWYHDGQLNTYQALAGDEKVHWMD